MKHSSVPRLCPRWCNDENFSRFARRRSARLVWPKRQRYLLPLCFGSRICDRHHPRASYGHFGPNFASAALFKESWKTRACNGGNTCNTPLADTPRIFPSHLAMLLLITISFLTPASGYSRLHSPVIKLPLGASLDDHLRVLGLLNSSIACFWLKQNSQNKGNGGIGGGIGDEDWEPRYEFTGTMPRASHCQPIDHCNQRKFSTTSPIASASVTSCCCSRTSSYLLTNNGISPRGSSDRLRASMIAQQEELDWQCYKLYGLTDEELTFDGDVPGIALGERAFEIALARKMSAGEETTAWFARHGSTPTTGDPCPPIGRLPRAHPAPARRHRKQSQNSLGRSRTSGAGLWNPGISSSNPLCEGGCWIGSRIARCGSTATVASDSVSVAQLADILDRDTEFCEVLRRWARMATLQLLPRWLTTGRRVGALRGGVPV